MLYYQLMLGNADLPVCLPNTRQLDTLRQDFKARSLPECYITECEC